MESVRLTGSRIFVHGMQYATWFERVSRREALKSWGAFVSGGGMKGQTTGLRQKNYCRDEERENYIPGLS